MTTLSKRLKTARAASKLTQKQLGKLAGIPQQSIASIEMGLVEQSGLTIKLASILNVSPLWLSGIDSESGLHNESISSSVGSVLVRGIVSAGNWTEAAEWPEDECYRIPSLVFDEYPLEKCFALLVQGDSMDEEYKDGAYLYCVSLPLISRKLKTGDHVIVERENNGKYESTVKEIEFDQSGKVLLWPRSSNPDHQAALVISDPSIANRADHTIIKVTALVIGHFYKRKT